MIFHSRNTYRNSNRQNRIGEFEVMKNGVRSRVDHTNSTIKRRRENSCFGMTRARVLGKTSDLLLMEDKTVELAIH